MECFKDTCLKCNQVAHPGQDCYSLGKVAGKVFRIGHLGDFNDLTLAGTLAGVEMGLQLAGVPHQKGGVAAALDYLTATASNAA